MTPESIHEYNSLMLLDIILVVAGYVLLMRNVVGRVKVEGDDASIIEISDKEQREYLDVVCSWASFYIVAYLVVKWVYPRYI